MDTLYALSRNRPKESPFIFIILRTHCLTSIEIQHVYFRGWSGSIADEIYKRMPQAYPFLCDDALDDIHKICQKTVKDLNVILCGLQEFQANVTPVNQSKRKNKITLVILIQLNKFCIRISKIKTLEDEF